MKKKLARIILWWTLVSVSSIPLYCLYHFYTDQSVINLFDKLIYTSGTTAIIFLLITLSITPLRRWLIWLFTLIPNLKWGKRLSDWNILIRYRRLMGLMSFYYASIHVCVYLTLELDLDIEELLYDIETRHHIIFGLAAWLLLLLLAITSITFIIKKMGKWWRRTHRMIYILGIAAVTHIFLASKATDSSPWIYIYLLSIFLLHRLFVIAIKKLRRKDDTGLEHFR